ncbi:tolloid-like protein 2 isoform X2 [Haliotis rufescens]|uniref:tolloid-like protein 2 isoform X2 n=1 Tax=Haliotis rufescens TaxID=6454 RepID=UPI00201EC197|nr:tolloid-like protein 2 isoform X2 [Haliotis rufescens]
MNEHFIGLYLVLLGPLLTETAHNTSVCGMEYLRASYEQKYLKSPGYPSNYENFLDCTWTIFALVGSNIKVEVLFLAMEDTISCTGDYLLFTDGSSTHAAQLDNICQPVTRSIVSSSSYMTIWFHTDRVVTRNGFNLKYTAGRFQFPKKAQGNNIQIEYNEAVIIQSTNYPMDYPNNENRGWTIRTNAKGYVIDLETMDFHLEYEKDCFFDYVQLYDGTDSSAPSLGRWCSITGPNKQSSGPSMFVTFKSDRKQTRSGFKLYFSAKKLPVDTPFQYDRPVMGGVIGGITVVIIIVLCCVFCRRRKADSNDRNLTHPNRINESSHTSNDNTSPTPVLNHIASVPPPSYNESVKDDPPSYIQAISFSEIQPS